MSRIKAQPVIIPRSSEDWPAVIDALYDLAASIFERYTIPAFTCSCGGAEPSCNSVLNNAADIRQQDTVTRISDWILNAAKELDDRYNNGDGEDLPTGPSALDNRLAVVRVRRVLADYGSIRTLSVQSLIRHIETALDGEQG